MTPFVRGAAPLPLLQRGPALTAAYLGGAARFAWPGDLLRAVREALGRLTEEHCSYCDSFPIDAVSEKQVDHFRPKALFRAEVCDWPNLYLVCTRCNKEKRDSWSEVLLRPDEAGYSFDRYFEANPMSGELSPSPLCSLEEKVRAEATIKIFNLQRPGLCAERRKALARQDAEYWADPERPFRFL